MRWLDHTFHEQILVFSFPFSLEQIKSFFARSLLRCCYEIITFFFALRTSLALFNGEQSVCFCRVLRIPWFIWVVNNFHCDFFFSFFQFIFLDLVEEKVHEILCFYFSYNFVECIQETVKWNWRKTNKKLLFIRWKFLMQNHLRIHITIGFFLSPQFISLMRVVRQFVCCVFFYVVTVYLVRT